MGLVANTSVIGIDRSSYYSQFIIAIGRSLIYEE